MTQTYWPFDTGAGTQITEARWDAMFTALLTDGPINDVMNELEVFADSSGMQVKIRSGRAHIQGKWLNSDAEESLAIAANGSGNPRIDRVVLRLDRTADTLILAVLQGTPAGSPSAPALTQTTSGIYEVSLAQVAVADGASTIAAGNVTDERTFASAQISPGGVTVLASDDLTGADFTVASGAFADVTGLAVTVDVPAGATVAVRAYVCVRNDTTPTTSGRVDVALRVDSGSSVAAVFGDGTTQVMATEALFAGLSAGSHTFKVQIADLASAGTVRVYFNKSRIIADVRRG